MKTKQNNFNLKNINILRKVFLEKFGLKFSVVEIVAALNFKKNTIKKPTELKINTLYSAEEEFSKTFSGDEKNENPIIILWLEYIVTKKEELKNRIVAKKIQKRKAIFLKKSNQETIKLFTDDDFSKDELQKIVDLAVVGKITRIYEFLIQKNQTLNLKNTPKSKEELQKEKMIEREELQRKLDEITESVLREIITKEEIIEEQIEELIYCFGSVSSNNSIIKIFLVKALADILFN